MQTLSATSDHKHQSTDNQVEPPSDDRKIKGSQYRFTLTKLIMDKIDNAGIPSFSDIKQTLMNEQSESVREAYRFKPT
ncbi:hypothetical protein [Pseudoalteromonas obscura]|uniref:Uncharacterized protein n=1 Tax=Pseudoalteromonas obscura TaxID=3048491 RepID=A0ABT7EQ45_9GAMM|nr:hypothetical protein [Pseudoalteromonas sp. P94(2023)]MDK2597118.1 hypothetical protein [Pseudoalteromonas sp. P94(2023)]